MRRLGQNGQAARDLRGVAMPEPLDRCCRDSTLFQFTSKRLRDSIDPDHLLIQISDWPGPPGRPLS